MQKVNPELFSFLKTLKNNNQRDWFNDHKHQFKLLQTEVKQVYTSIFNSLNTFDEIDSFKLFRIYRDVRFSKNKQPYKTHIGGSFNRVKPQYRGGYYVHLEPENKSFIAIGFWQPNKEDLFRIRKELEQDADEFEKLIQAKPFKNIWGELEGEELKTAPKGFDKLHQNIKFIRKKQYIFSKAYTDKEVLSSDFIHSVNQAFKTVRPFYDYMSDVLTTNLNGESLI